MNGRMIMRVKHIEIIDGDTSRLVPAVVIQSDQFDGKFRPCRRLPGGRWVVTKRYIRTAVR